MKVAVPANRGIIYDRKGRPLALNTKNYVAYQIENLNSGQMALLKRHNLTPFDTLNRHGERIGFISIEEKDSLDKPFNGKIVFEESNRRYYTVEGMRSSLVGFVGDDGVGLMGLEHRLNPLLTGKSGYEVYLRTGDMKKLFLKDKKKPCNGISVKTTIDAYIQSIAYSSLKEQVDAKQAKGGFVVVTNPYTGEILALVSYPSYNLDARGRMSSHAPNFAVQTPYEPGSTFKIVTYTAAFERRLITPEDSIDTNNGYIVVDKKRIRDVHKLGKISYREALVYSSNVAAAGLALKLGSKNLYKTSAVLGFGSPTGSFLMDESNNPGNSKRWEKWKDSKTANFGIGYGILVNGLQMAMAYGAVANGGFLLCPKLIKSKAMFRGRKVMSERTDSIMKSLFKDVVEYGTGKAAKIRGLSIAGKTGTSMMIDTLTNRYNPHKLITSFIGFFPVQHPKYLIYVVIFEPKGPSYLTYGGTVAAPVFKKIAKILINLRYREI